MFRSIIKKLNSYPALVAVIIALAVGAYLVNPVKYFGDEVVVPAAERTGIPDAVGLSDKLCRDGWRDISTEDEHSKVLSCTKVVNGEEWIVVLMPDESFSHGYKNAPGAEFIFDAERIPAWIK